MENASKALLIAAGILIAIMVVTLLVIGWNSISSYFQAKDENTRIVQLSEFNQEFENYTNAESIRGTDILSLMGKVEDYNDRKLEVYGEGYSEMHITVKLTTSQYSLNKYLYNLDTGKDKENNGDWLLKATYTEENISDLLSKVSALNSYFRINK